MEVSIEELRSQKEILKLATEALYCEKKIVVRLMSDKIEAEFMDELGKIAASTGSIIGVASGAYGGLITIEEIVGFAVAGTTGIGVAIAIGALVGYALGALIGYSLGAWLAHFLYKIAGNNGRIEVKKLWTWFGLRKNRVRLKVIRAS